jgi:hypothetical protein
MVDSQLCLFVDSLLGKKNVDWMVAVDCNFLRGFAKSDQTTRSMGDPD